MRRLIFCFMLILGLVFPTSAIAVDPLGTVCTDHDTATACTNSDQQIGENSLYGSNGILTRVAQFITLLVGAAAVIMIIIGGIQYITSSGDPTNITNAKNTILYAIIGLVVAMMAQAIISFVLVRL